MPDVATFEQLGVEEEVSTIEYEDLGDDLGEDIVDFEQGRIVPAP